MALSVFAVGSVGVLGVVLAKQRPAAGVQPAIPVVSPAGPGVKAVPAATRKWTDAAALEIETAYGVNPVTAADKPRGTRWRIAVTVEVIDPASLVTDKGTVSVRDAGQARSVVTGGRYWLDVELTFSSHNVFFTPLFVDGLVVAAVR